MAQVYLRTKKEEGNAKLYTLVRRNGLQLQVCTGIVVNIREWQKSEKSQSAKTKYYSTAEGKRVNEDIVKVNQAIDQLFKEGRINTKEDKQLIEDAISDIVLVESRKLKDQAKAIRKEQESTLINFCEKVTQGIETGSIRNKGHKATQATIENFRYFFLTLKDFLIGREDTGFNDIDSIFADEFVTYLECKGWMQSTINKEVGNFHRLCSIAAEMGVNKNATSLKVWHQKKVQKEEATAKVYLTDEEIDALYNMDLKGVQDQVRDLFVIACLTCQRFSDFSTLTRDNFKKTESGTPILCLNQKKTGTYVEVPIFDSRVTEICEKYGYKFPVFLKNNFNVRIKIVMKKLAKTVPSMGAKFPTALTKNTRQQEQRFKEMDTLVKAGGSLASRTDQILYASLCKYARENNGQPLFERNEKGEILRHKWELVTSHTGRRSGITNLYKTGILDSREIMGISGHKTEEIYKEYIKVSVSEQADRTFEKLRAARG